MVRKSVERWCLILLCMIVLLFISVLKLKSELDELKAQQFQNYVVTNQHIIQYKKGGNYAD